MSSQVNVLAIDALDELRSALVRFAADANASMQAAMQETHRILEWMAERQAFWQREVRRRQEMLQQAQAALRHCQSEVYYDRDGRPERPDCSAYEAQLSRARAFLHEGEDELRNVVQWSRQVQQAVADYRREAQRLAGLLVSDLPQSTALLGRAVADLQSYLSVLAAPASFASGAAAAAALQASGLSGQSQGSPEHSMALAGALDRLSRSIVGAAVAAAIRSAGTNLRFGETASGAIAHFDSVANEIVLHRSLQAAPAAVLAAHLAHEGTHVQWDGGIYSLDEEYHAFRNQAAVWNELKGAESDGQCDWVSGIIALGETRAKWQIAALYPDLPEYS